jgi:hypothetical protein
VTFSISFGGIEQNGQAGSIKLIKELAPVLDRRLRSLDEKIGRPGNKLQLNGGNSRNATSVPLTRPTRIPVAIAIIMPI